VVGGWVLAGSAVAAEPAPGAGAGNGLDVQPGQAVPGLVWSRSEGTLSGEPLPGSEGRAEPEPPREGRERKRAGEEEGTLETDRDSFTPAIKTVGKGLFILESAYSFIDNKGVAETHSFPELLVRYGLLERLELRLGWNYEVGGGGNDVSGSPLEISETGTGGTVVREHRVSYGLKLGVSEQEGWLPQSALLVMGITPTGGESTATQVTAAYIFGWTLPNRWKADFALRYGTNSEEGDHFGVWAPSAV